VRNAYAIHGARSGLAAQPNRQFWISAIAYGWIHIAFMDLNYQRQIIAFHGCDAEVVAKVLAGDDKLDKSEETYDWLGTGSYFWEHGPQRAYDWAMEEHARVPEKIKTPAVLGAYINLGQCFDLLDTANTKLLQEIFPEFERLIAASHKTMPSNRAVRVGENDKVLRFLDCAVLNFALSSLAKMGRDYHTVRGAFVEGGEAFPGSEIRVKTHIQIAVRRPECIVGFFRPVRSLYIS
jgi:hypothetical protein